MIRVLAPARLHFGLLGLPTSTSWPGLDGAPGLPMRSHGGVGMMIEAPGTEVLVTLAADWSAEGPHADRALEFAQRCHERLRPRLPAAAAWRIKVVRAPAPHTGLGSGTQLGLAVARAMAVAAGHGEIPVEELAAAVGRGERSAIGVHGFERGGLIVDAGRHPHEPIAPLAAQVSLPPDWGVLLLIPTDSDAKWFGARERAALASFQMPPEEVNNLCRLILTGILPAATRADIETFGEALYEFNARIGDHFAPAQGGRYSSPAVADGVRLLRSLGIRGAGQSSWGPTVFGLARKELLRELLAPIRQRFDGTVLLTRPSQGARVERAGTNTPPSPDAAGRDAM